MTNNIHKRKSEEFQMFNMEEIQEKMFEDKVSQTFTEGKTKRVDESQRE